MVYQLTAFLPRDACYSAAYAVVQCLVGRLSVTFVHCVETAKIWP